MKETKRPECPVCGVQGWYEITVAAHAPDCNGECRNCPVPEPAQEQCAICAYVDQQDAALASLQKEFDDYKARNYDPAESIRLNAEIVRLTNTLAAAEERCRELERDVKGLEDTISTYYSIALDKARTDNAALRDELDKAQEGLSLRTVNEGLVEDIKSLKQSVNALRERLLVVEKQYQKYKDKIITLNDAGWDLWQAIKQAGGEG